VIDTGGGVVCERGGGGGWAERGKLARKKKKTGVGAYAVASTNARYSSRGTWPMFSWNRIERGDDRVKGALCD